MATPSWHTRPRNYEAERRQLLLHGEEVTNHPLRPSTVTVTEGKIRKTGYGKGSRSSSISSDKSSSSNNSLLDPLSALDAGDPLSQIAAAASDPLSQMAAQMSLSEPAARKKAQQQHFAASEESEMDDGFEPWSARKAGILSKYTTSEKLSITTSFLSASDKEKVVVKQASSVSDKVKNRLEQLDDFEEGSVQEMLNLSQQDYVQRIEDLNNALIIAWDQDQRVKSLKIAIQCAKLLADISVIQFYPSKFVLITDILDTFGRLVFDRIYNKATYVPKGASIPVRLPANFTPDQVPESAKETCRNWFFKIASIRELIPRFYVEAAILKCYSFLTSGEYSQALKRLALTSRGIGDPLVAIYSRCYLCRVGVKIAPEIRDHLMICFDDFLATRSQFSMTSIQQILKAQKVEQSRYFTLYSPALDWILQCIAYKAPEQVLLQVMDRCSRQCNSPLLLNSVMSAFTPEYVASRAVEFCQMIKECEESGFPKHLMYRSLGMCLVTANPPEDQRLNILNEVWKIVIKLKIPADYIGCAEVWIEYVVKNFSKREVNTILGDIIKHMTPDRAYEDFYPQLQSVVNKVLTHIHDFSLLFSLDKFLPFIDMFQKDSVKVEVCKMVTEAFSRHQTEPTSDPVITNALMFICKTMHDSVNALTLTDEVRAISQLIISFVRLISYGRDFEQQLTFYVETRAAFSNIDTVLVYLVQCVNRLAMNTRQVVKGNHTRKTAAFVRACAAYSFITIPSLSGIFSRLNLYLVSAQVALLNQCLSQADASFKAAVSLLAEYPRLMELDGKMRSAEPFLLDFFNNFISTLLVVPDNPEQGVLYMVRGLLNVIENYQWDPNQDTKYLVFISVLAMLSAASQEKYIYHADKVDANDSMYGHDGKFLNEIAKLAHTLVEEVLNHLKTLDNPQSFKRQSSVAYELFLKMVQHADLRAEKPFSMAVMLWGLTQKHGTFDTKLSIRTLEWVKQRGQREDGQSFAELAQKMHIQTRT